MEEFDYVIVGGGSAGAVLANRLSGAGATACVLEAGARDRNPFIHVPAGFVKTLHDPAVTWRFQSEPGEWTGGRRIDTTQGKVLGGSSSVNGMVFVRGQPGDYDAWAQRGNRGWSYAEVLPYFKRLERRIGPATIGTAAAKARCRSPIRTGAIRCARRSSPARTGRAFRATPITTARRRKASATTSA